MSRETRGQADAEIAAGDVVDGSTDPWSERGRHNSTTAEFKTSSRLLHVYPDVEWQHNKSIRPAKTYWPQATKGQTQEKQRLTDGRA